VEGVKVKKKDFFGFHAVFYYYGIEHLLINMHHYIKNAIDNNDYVYLCLEENSFNLLLNYFTEDEKKHIGILTVSSLINLFKSEGKNTVNKALDKYIKNVFEYDCIGTGIICDSTHILKEISKTDFIKFQEFLSKGINGLNISIMSLYDMYDYINFKAIIDDELMAISQQVSDYRLYQMKLCKINKGDEVDSFISRTCKV